MNPCGDGCKGCEFCLRPKIGHFDICKEMANRGMDIRMSLLDNVVLLKKVKSGTEVTIGCDGDLVGAIYKGKFLGGLLLCDREQYRQIEKELNGGGDERQSG